MEGFLSSAPGERGVSTPWVCAATSPLRRSLARPRLGNLAPARHVIHDQDQVVIVVAVEHFDVDAGLGHSPCQQAELTGDSLLEALDDNVPFLGDADAGSFQS